MASTRSRPSTVASKSFTRFEPSQPVTKPGHRHRASTLESSAPSRLSTDRENDDVFNKVDPEIETPDTPDLAIAQSFPDKFDELPVELISLTDRFIESLGNKAFEQPPSIEQIADLFQEFYVRAAASINIHISTLITRLNRDVSPKPPPARSRTLPTKPNDDTPADGAASGAQRMLTATEVTEKRKARKMLEYKRLLLEEAVERRACDKVYRKIWRHKSTLDEVQDEKLRSKTAALALVGIGLKDLGIELDSKSGKSLDDVQDLLVPARNDLMRMSDETCPLGKLQHLTKAHKTIVDTLYQIHGSSSSADEILPTLIYTLITVPVEGINIISNLNFIQRFRTTSKIDGEAAYCMTNLEAAISFLENVDLSSLRADEFPEGPRKTPSQPGTPVAEKSDPFPLMPTTAVVTGSTSSSAANTPDAQSKLKTSIAPAKPLPSPRHQRTISDLLQPVAAANEAVRLKANEGIENITNTLDNSFKFLFGRLKEKAADPSSPKDLIVPKTLDEALHLVSRSPGPENDATITSETSSVNDKELLESPVIDKTDKIMSLFGGKKAGSIRDRSVDSQKSNTSSRRVTFGAATGIAPDSHVMSKEPIQPATVQTTPMDSVKNLGSTLNPFANIGNAFGGGFGRFGRPSPTPVTSASVAVLDDRKEMTSDAAAQKSNQIGIPVHSADAIAAKIRAVDPPINRFVQMEDSSELRLKEIPALLEDYKRLANLLRELASG